MGKQKKDVMTPPPDHYTVLQVKPSADQEVIEAAFRALMGKLRLGGSLVPSDLELAQALTVAHRTLMDPEARRLYDQNLKVGDPRDVGGFRITRRIAESDSCYVYGAEHRLNGVQVCVKHCFLVDRTAQGQLVHESGILSRLRHYCLPAWHDLVSMPDETHAMIMSYVPGLTVEELVQRVGAIEPKHVAWIMDRLLNALLYMGSVHGIVHADLNPKTVIVHGGTHLATPVGFSHAVKEGQPPTCRNDLYSSSEQVAGASLDARADLFSLGWLAVYMLSGGDDAVKRRDVPKGLPPAMRRFLTRLINLDRDNRASWTDASGAMVENLCATWSRVRVDSLGSEHTKYEPLPGLNWDKVA